MNLAVANNTNYINHKSQTKKQNNQSKGSFEDYLKHSEHQNRQNNKAQEIPNAADPRVLKIISPNCIKLSEMKNVGIEKMTKEESDALKFAFFGETISSLDYELDPKNWTTFFDTPGWVRHVQEGIMFREQYFDFTNAHEFDRLTKEADYTGMSNAEKYMAIYDKYKYCYGEDFMKGDSVAHTTLVGSRCSDVYSKFEKELQQAFGSREAWTKAYKQAQYGKMSDGEVHKAIRNKYPPLGELTYLELYHMTNELNQVGLGIGLKDLIVMSSGIYRNKGGIVTLDSLVNQQFIKTMRDYYTYQRSAGFSVNPELSNTMGYIFS